MSLCIYIYTHTYTCESDGWSAMSHPVAARDLIETPRVEPPT